MTIFKPTEEQIAAITTAHSGETFVLDACAGSGKTSTARKMCEAIGGDILYLVYNSAAAADAKKSFPRHVKVSTTSALAWHHFPEYQARMRTRVKAKDTAAMARIEPVKLAENLMPIRPTTIASYATKAIERFCHSADKKIGIHHVFIDLPLEPAPMAALREAVLYWAKYIWRETIKPDSRHYFSYDHAFKLLTMSAPDLGHTTVIIDEAQDSNYCTLALINAQINSQKVCIGDPNQELYAWRGAQNIMGEFEGPRLSLTKSFRFGERVAEEANKWLEHTGSDLRVIGNEKMDSIVTDGGLESPDAILCRHNATVMVRSMALLAQNKKVAIVGGTKMLTDLAYAAVKLRKGEPVDHPELAIFADWGELMAYTHEPGGGDLKALVQLINDHGVQDILNACKEFVPETEAEAKRQYKEFVPPDVVLSTAHKSKGREWDTVEIADDFKEPKESVDPFTGNVSPGFIEKSAAQLHYVTVTRGRKHVNRLGLAWVDRHTKKKVTA